MSPHHKRKCIPHKPLLVVLCCVMRPSSTAFTKISTPSVAEKETIQKYCMCTLLLTSPYSIVGIDIWLHASLHPWFEIQFVNLVLPWTCATRAASEMGFFLSAVTFGLQTSPNEFNSSCYLRSDQVLDQNISKDIHVILLVLLHPAIFRLSQNVSLTTILLIYQSDCSSAFKHCRNKTRRIKTNECLLQTHDLIIVIK